MCGRFVSAAPPDEIARYFSVGRVEVAEEAHAPRYNVAPTDDVYVVVESEGERRLAAHHWGLVPFWADDPSVGSRMINARAEGIADKGAYKAAFARRRCIVPADGFYEWRKTAGKAPNQPLYLRRADGEPLALAGLWEEWRSRDRAVTLRSCTIITGEPNRLVVDVHDRMPVILPPSAWSTWLDEGNDDVERLGELLVPAPDDLLVMHPVSTEVNGVKADGPHLIEPVDPAQGDTGDATGGDAMPGQGVLL
ncbi:SOS response-associated peptidase [soil metagenome]